MISGWELSVDNGHIFLYNWQHRFSWLANSTLECEPCVPMFYCLGDFHIFPHAVQPTHNGPVRASSISDMDRPGIV